MTVSGFVDDGAYVRETSRRRQSMGLGFGLAGGHGTRLLAGPNARRGRESLRDHDTRLGPIQSDLTDDLGLRDLARRSAIEGRGGGEFPLARKLDTAFDAPGVPLVVVNGAEGEPASRKDQTLLALRPHLVLDGAVVAAAAVGADAVIVYAHKTRNECWRALELALAERRAVGRDAVAIQLVDAPGGFVSGEAHAVASFLTTGVALPVRAEDPLARRGVHGRPTVVSNTETLAHLALIARYGAEWFHEAGSPESPGSTLITLAGAVRQPGLVVEVVAGVTIGSVLEAYAGIEGPPRAILVGGYSGTWVSGVDAWDAPLDRWTLAQAGVRLGCGVIGVLDNSSCGLVETQRLTDYLASQTAGQCGACVFGLPTLARQLEFVTTRGAGRADVRRIHELTVSMSGRGACAHPDGAVSLVDGALEVFADEIREHGKRGKCKGRDCDRETLFPVVSATAREGHQG